MVDASLLAGKSILITGAGRGIGRELALAAAAAGARVCVNDLGTSTGGAGTDADVADSVVDEIRAAGGEAIADSGDVASWSDAQKMVDCTLQAFGSIDGVVNNAAIIDLAPFDETDPERFLSVLSVDLVGAFHVSRAAAPKFKTQGAGAFLHMTSSAGLIGAEAMAAYSAAKAGVVQLSKIIALDLTRYGVRSNCLAPSATSRASADAQKLRGLVTPTATVIADEGERKGSPAHVTPVALFLLSDLAKDVNGQVFGVRKNELYLYSQSRPVRIIQSGDGWTPAQISSRMEGWRSAFHPAEESLHTVFNWPAC